MIRPLAIVLMGFSLAGCGVGMPPPTKQKVTAADIAGTWRYSGMTPKYAGEITFQTNGTFSLILRGPRAAFTNTGTWSLTSDAHLDLKPFWTLSTTQPGTVDEHESVRWWVTSWYTKGVAPFGGDSLDPDQYNVMSRLEK